MLDFTTQYGDPIPEHVWMGVTVESEEFKGRIDVLRKVPVKIRFISFEPLLGPVGPLNLKEVSWVIVGGESGPEHRAMKTEWAREIREQSIAQGVPFFFKQWGGLRAKSGGRILDGRIWDEYPSCKFYRLHEPLTIPDLQRTDLISKI